MAKVQMKKIFICGPKKRRKEVLELLQRTGLVEIRSGDIADESLSEMDVHTQVALFKRSEQKAAQALKSLDECAPKKTNILSSLNGPEDMGTDTYYEEAANVIRYMDTASEINELARDIAEQQAAIPKYISDKEALSAWSALDIPLSYSGTGSTAVFIGSVAEALSAADIYGRLSSVMDSDTETPMEIEIISSDDHLTSFTLFCLSEDAAEVEKALKQIDFARAPFSTMVPAEEIAALDRSIASAEQEIERLKGDIAKYQGEREHLEFAVDYYAMRADKYDILGTIPQSQNAFFISGYTPAESSEKLVKKLEELGTVVEITDPAPTDQVPCALKNPYLADPMETVVESYSMPGPREIDPSSITACFYYIMFGMMFSDAGYGILLALGSGGAMLLSKNMRPGMKRMMKLFFFSGISTTFWGFMFGSFFGDAVNVIATTFFGRPDIALNPIWFSPQDEPMRLLSFAFLLGIIHLFTGLTIKLYQLLRAGQVKDAIYDVVFWYMFVGGGIIYLLTMSMITEMLSLSFTLGPTVAKISGALAIIGAIGVVLTGGRESRNWFKRGLKGLYAAYGVTSYLSDVLSYSRLLALGLATGVIAQVFNKMGSMMGSSIIGIILFIAIFAVGHLLNMAINVLGAYVHTNRLQFVEFFNKFYEGGGRKFAPFMEHTKYYEIKEEI